MKELLKENLKNISLLSIVVTLISYLVFFSYLNQSGVKLSVLYVLSPMSIIAIFIISVGISLVLYFLIIFVPQQYDFIENEINWFNTGININLRFIFHLLITFSYIFTILIFLRFSDNKTTLYITASIELVIGASLLFYLYKGHKDRKILLHLFNFVMVLFMLFLLFFILSIILLFLLHTSFYKIDNEHWFIVSIFLCFLYSLSVGFVNFNKNKNVKFIPLIAITFLIIYFIFSSHVTGKLMKTIGIGYYQSTYILDIKSKPALSKKIIENSEISDNKQSMTLNNVWVIASLFDKIIISESKDSNLFSIIPQTSILGEKREKILNSNK